MVHIVKNIKQKLPQLKINIRLGLQLAFYALLYEYSGSISTVIWVFLICKCAGFILRLIGHIIFSGLGILILIIIISLIII